jgi:hypothetical protein
LCTTLGVFRAGVAFVNSKDARRRDEGTDQERGMRLSIGHPAITLARGSFSK